MRALRILRDSFPGRPAYDTALSHALLRRVAAGDLPESLRLYQPDDVVLFSLLDARRPGFGAAVEAARRAGFAAVLRLAGGHAAVFSRDSLAFAWAIPHAEPRSGIRARFEAVSGLIARALCELGVDARVGEVAGEYCPGEYSVNARGRTKLMGVGQRVVRGGAHVGGVIVTGDSDRVRDVLVPVYRALELDWRPETTGCIVDEIGASTPGAVAEALIAELGRPVVAAALDSELLSLADTLVRRHEPDSLEGDAVPAPIRADGKALTLDR